MKDLRKLKEDLILVARDLWAVIEKHAAEAPAEPSAGQVQSERPMQSSAKILYSKKEAAVMLNMSVRSLDTRIARGEIKAVHKGRLVRIHRNEMERWAKIDEHRVVATIERKP